MFNINGKERPVYNSKCNRIAKSEKSLRVFYKWFGDSKVVDSKGRPRVMYHGTEFEFDSFNSSKPIFLSESRDVAQWFSIYGKGTVEGRNIKTVYAKKSNPLVADAKERLFGDIDFNRQTLSAEDIFNYANQQGYDGTIINNVKEVSPSKKNSTKAGFENNGETSYNLTISKSDADVNSDGKLYQRAFVLLVLIGTKTDHLLNTSEAGSGLNLMDMFVNRK